jgi:hypothetical protein
VVATVLQYARGRTDDDAIKKYRERIPTDIVSPPCPGCDCDCSCEECAVCLATLTISCGTFEVEIDGECRRPVWSPRLFKWLLCGILGNLDKVPADTTPANQPLPNTTGIYAQPMRTAWEVGALALTARRLQDEVRQLSNRLATLEKAQSGKAKGKDQG